jgi:PAS domain S-box-containing protein
MYFAEPRSPSGSDLELIAGAARVALIAIEQKRTETALRESEERFRQMADAIPEVIWITSLNPHKLLYVSPSFERIWGLPAGDLYRNPRLWTETIHPEDRERVVGTFTRWISGEQVNYHDVEFRIVQPNGAIRWIHERGVVTLDDHGKPCQVSGISTDITERKKAEDELRRSEAYLAEAQRLSRTGSFGWKVSSGELFWSRETFCIVGYDPGTKPTLDLVLERVHPADLALVRQTVEQASRGGSDVDFEHRFLCPDGSVKYVHVVARPVTDASGNREFIGAVSDVTATKLAQEKIRQNETELRRLVDAVPQHVFVLGADGTHLYSNRVAREYHGLSVADPQVDHLAVFAHPDDMAGALARRQRMVARGESYEMEVRLRANTGSYRWFLIRAKPLVDERGQIIRWYGTRTDIEDRKCAEEKLRQDERELRRITDAIPEAISVLAPDGTMLYANQIVLDYTGLNLDDVKAGNFRDRLFHAEDLERFRDRRERALDRGEPFDAELRVRRNDGQYRWFLVRYNPLRDDAGQVIRWYVTGIDIDDRKQAEVRVEKENLALREEIDHSSMFEEIVGSSAPLRKVLGQVTKVAPTDSTVLILGETGTGKELIARAIHKRSKRAGRAFIRVNCASIPQSLIASEMFGHEKGAFTGALQRRLGRFELADGGTIFLDEIGELPAETQLSLLRVLQEREIERVGSSQPVAVDVRVLAATNRDLKAAIGAGAFRQDLFYRLNVFPIQMPSLRDRKDDIPLLVEYLIDRYAKQAGKKFKHIDKKTLSLFQGYDWPGNVRELQNVIERAMVLCDGEIFSVDETWLRRDDSRLRPAVPLVATLAEREKELIESVLSESHGQVAGRSGAAAKLGIPRQTLESKIKALGIDKHRFKSR